MSTVEPDVEAAGGVKRDGKLEKGRGRKKGQAPETCSFLPLKLSRLSDPLTGPAVSSRVSKLRAEWTTLEAPKHTSA
jgi:hypothetical protein